MTADLTELRLALASASAAVLAAREEEDRKYFEHADRLMGGLELSPDAGRWHPVYLAAVAVGFVAAVLAGAVRRVRGA